MLPPYWRVYPIPVLATATPLVFQPTAAWTGGVAGRFPPGDPLPGLRFVEKALPPQFIRDGPQTRKCVAEELPVSWAKPAHPVLPFPGSRPVSGAVTETKLQELATVAKRRQRRLPRPEEGVHPRMVNPFP